MRLSNLGQLRSALPLVLISLAIFVAACDGGQPQDLDVLVRLGEARLNPSKIRVKQGDRVTLKIDSQQAGEVHLHGYDLKVDVEAGEAVDLLVPADITGRFRITFHQQEEDHYDDQAVHDDEEGELEVGELEVSPR